MYCLFKKQIKHIHQLYEKYFLTFDFSAYGKIIKTGENIVCVWVTL